MLRFSLPERTQYIDELLSKFPDTPTLTLAKKAYKEHPRWWNNLDSCRSMLRNLRGNMGNMTRSYTNKKHFRPNGKAGELPSCPPSSAKPWTPYVLAGKQAAILSDLHVPYHDEKAINAAVKFIRQEFDIDTMILNGDFFDFYALSRWDKNPEQRNFKRELKQGKAVLDWLIEFFPKAKFVFKAGNHEERWDKFLWQKAPELVGLPHIRLKLILGCKKRSISYIDDQRPIMFGGDTTGKGSLPIFHGHEVVRGGIANPVNPARGAFLRTLHTCIIGHLHQSSQHTETDLFKDREISCWSTGALCMLHPEYSRVNRWCHGFAVVGVASPGKWRVHNYRISKKGEVW